MSLHANQQKKNPNHSKKAKYMNYFFKNYGYLHENK